MVMWEQTAGSGMANATTGGWLWNSTIGGDPGVPAARRDWRVSHESHHCFYQFCLAGKIQRNRGVRFGCNYIAFLHRASVEPV
ncbi:MULTISPECIES: hypothetical protein [unclassified Oceanispirochaeta]|uniref:hypothetical protein n=1 Tax=unclassified Oceanispirochaeta TaxID=2635722 RepID=UPI000E096095|nr:MULTISPECIES: hypothetical protein [unclassified Oceanispirochaeta]MBF9018736.1 hypothetical protein [Oceanispirochaeta sp. M2]NPD75174.1 hypothetical protein [Oceanispirochaeta sp. M1]RDG28957.1 hypothetical protein DV872_24060 [Oceanispirochaeta sp. M1]